MDDTQTHESHHYQLAGINSFQYVTRQNQLVPFTDSIPVFTCVVTSILSPPSFTHLGNKTGHFVAVELVGVLPVHIDKCHFPEPMAVS